MDRTKIKSLTFIQNKKLAQCLTTGGHSGTIDNLVADAVEIVLNFEAKRRNERDDIGIIVPDKEGFWTPMND